MGARARTRKTARRLSCTFFFLFSMVNCNCFPLWFVYLYFNIRVYGLLFSVRILGLFRTMSFIYLFFVSPNALHFCGISFFLAPAHFNGCDQRAHSCKTKMMSLMLHFYFVLKSILLIEKKIGHWIVTDTPSRMRMQRITSEIIGMWREEHRIRYQQNARVLLTLKTKKPGARKNGENFDQLFTVGCM